MLCAGERYIIWRKLLTEEMMLCLENVRFEIFCDFIVRDFSLNLQHGEVKALFGPSGSV